MGDSYKIVRFYSPSVGKAHRVVARGLSLEDAQRHCSDPRTRKVGKDGSVEWFDGYTAED